MTAPGGFVLYVGVSVIAGAAVLFTVLLVASVVLFPSQSQYGDLDVEYEGPAVTVPRTVDLTVVGPDGAPVADMHLIVRGDTLALGETHSFYTGENSHTVSIAIDSDPARGDLTPDWRPGQTRGNLSIELIPPADTGYVDDRANTEVTVVRNGTVP